MDSRCPALKLREAVSMYFTMLAVFLVILVVALQGTAPRENHFPYKVPLDPRGTLELSWNVSYHLEEVYFQILVKELKFGVFFGMSDRGDFENADLAVLWSDGFQSYFAVSCLDLFVYMVHLSSTMEFKTVYMGISHSDSAWIETFCLSNIAGSSGTFRLKQENFSSLHPLITLLGKPKESPSPIS